MQENITPFRYKLLKIVVLISFIGTLINIPIFYMFNKPFAFFLIPMDIAYLIMYIILQRGYLTVNVSANIILSMIFVTLIMIPIMNILESFIVDWVTLYPVIVFSLKDHKQALIGSLLFLMVFFLLFLFSFFDPSYEFLHISTMGMRYISLTILLYVILGHMETKDKELNELNLSLESRVQKAVVDMREQEKLMLHQNRLAQMGEMIAMIAHQWRQPLSAICAAAGSMQINIALNKYNADDFKERLKNISNYAQHLSVTIDDFRYYFKPNKYTNTFDVSTSINNAIKLCEILFSNLGIEVSLNLQQTKEITSFENELVQVLINLFKNAVDILEERKIASPKISIGLIDNQNGSLSIEISDNAGGVPEEIAEKIFDPYFSTKDNKNGTGLGLYMSKSIIEEHCQGKLSFHNTDLGACFKITL